ncbi:hypothetical protein [Citrobacter koseri]|uniref:hypothetical protein n=1 Tax=Citrobacter koseri TaxID=545 RepID=UPI0023AF658B|nr:hypothetical protein [Citrobacter koseri]
MLTLKHFIDRPTWAAAAGYNFNYLDCMAYTADLYRLIFSALRDVFRDFLSTEVREIPLMLAVITAAISGVFVWPFIFWIVAIPVWLKCRRMRSSYQFGGAMTETAEINLKRWQRECEKKWRANP